MKHVKRYLRARFGWIPLYELRNKALLGHTAVRMRRFEDASVRRFVQSLGPDHFPAARVVTIIPTYRRPDRLLRAIDSALAQTITDQLVVVVDDAGGLPRLPADPRVRAISLGRNIGVPGVSRNIGMRLTDSRFVAFLDDDNVWHPHHLEVALARLDGASAGQRARPDGVYTAMRRVDPDGRERDIVSVPFDRELAKNQGFLDVSTFVVHRSPAVRFSRLKRAKEVMPKEDWELMYRYSRTHRLEHIPVLTVDYLVNPDSYWTPWKDADVSMKKGATGT